MFKETKIIGIPLWLYLILGVILMTAVYVGALPGDFTGAFAITVYWGSLFNFVFGESALEVMIIGAAAPIIKAAVSAFAR